MRRRSRKWGGGCRVTFSSASVSEALQIALRWSWGGGSAAACCWLQGSCSECRAYAWGCACSFQLSVIERATRLDELLKMDQLNYFFFFLSEDGSLENIISLEESSSRNWLCRMNLDDQGRIKELKSREGVRPCPEWTFLLRLWCEMPECHLVHTCCTVYCMLAAQSLEVPWFVRQQSSEELQSAFNFDEVLISSVAHPHPACFVVNGFDDDGTKSHTSSLAFL